MSIVGGRFTGAPSHKNTGLSIGFYGCSNRVVRVESGGRPRSARVDCPACGLNHRIVNLLWRPPLDGERGEVVL